MVKNISDTCVTVTMETLHHRNVHGVQKYCSDISLSTFLSIIEVDFLTSRNLKSWRGGGPRGPRGSCTYACTCMEIYARFVNCVELLSYALTFSTSDMKLRSQLNHHQSIFRTQWSELRKVLFLAPSLSGSLV